MVYGAFPSIEGFQVEIPIVIGDQFLVESLNDFCLVKSFGAIEKIERLCLPFGNFLDYVVRGHGRKIIKIGR